VNQKNIYNIYGWANWDLNTIELISNKRNQIYHWPPFNPEIKSLFRATLGYPRKNLINKNSIYFVQWRHPQVNTDSYGAGRHGVFFSFENLSNFFFWLLSCLLGFPLGTSSRKYKSVFSSWCLYCAKYNEFFLILIFPVIELSAMFHLGPLSTLIKFIK
jgi:hypothetical protein